MTVFLINLIRCLSQMAGPSMILSLEIKPQCWSSSGTWCGNSKKLPSTSLALWQLLDSLLLVGSREERGLMVQYLENIHKEYHLLPASLLSIGLYSGFK